ncbi:hypothetical protein Btru_075261 [Bulinus truncatus]|nr:hypothetical protein Btru_075261 [Bulinus truncatus]
MMPSRWVESQKWRRSGPCWKRGCRKGRTIRWTWKTTTTLVSPAVFHGRARTGRQERLNSDSEQHCSGLKDMKPSDIPEAAPRPMPHATRSEPHAHGRFGCEDRQMPELIPKWKNGLDFKPSISLEPDYIDDSLSNHILPEHPPSFSSDPPRYHDILSTDHLVNMDSSKGNAADLPGRFFPSQGPHSATHNFQPLISVKTEIDCPAFAPEPERETIRCENPFTHPSEIGCRTTSLNLPKLMLSDELPLNHDRRFVAPSWTNSMAAASANYNANTKAEAAPHNPFFNPTEKSAGLPGQEEDSRNSIESMSSPSMSRSGMSSTPVPCRSSYSPDIIKVLLDQVGGEKIKGIKHEIMNTVASRFGPEEYEATKQLLSSYTESADRGSKGHYACFPHDRYSENSLPLHPLSSNMSQLPGNKPAAGISPTSGAVMRGGAHQRASSNHRDVLPPLSEIDFGLRWFGQASGAPLNGDDDVHLSDSSKHAPAFPLPHTETMDTDDTLDMCASDGFDSQMLSDRYDSAIDLRSSDKARIMMLRRLVLNDLETFYINLINRIEGQWPTRFGDANTFASSFYELHKFASLFYELHKFASSFYELHKFASSFYEIHKFASSFY